MLVRQYFTEGFYPTGQAVPEDKLNPSAALLKAIVVNGALDTRFRQFMNDNEALEFEELSTGPDIFQVGHGLVPKCPIYS